GLGDLLRKITGVVEASEARVQRSQQLGSTGITEIGSQVSAALEHFTPVKRTSPWWLLGGLFVILGLVGPLDYWLVDRVWRRPLATWVSFPLLLLICGGFSLWAAVSTNGEVPLLNQLDILDVDVASGGVRGRHA